MDIIKTIMLIGSKISHLVFGMLTSITSSFSPILALIMFLIYMTYQLVDNGDVEEVKNDIIDYAIGLSVYPLYVILYSML